MLQKNIVGERYDSLKSVAYQEVGSRVWSYCRNIFDAVEGDKNHHAIEWRDVVGRAVNQITVEEQDRTTSSFRRDDSIAVYKFGDHVAVERISQLRGQIRNPIRTIAICRRSFNLGAIQSVACGYVDHSFFVRTRDQEDWSIEFRHLVEKNDGISCARCGHPILFLPVGVILMPFPHVSRKCRLGVDLELVNIDIALQNLYRRFDNAGMPR